MKFYEAAAMVYSGLCEACILRELKPIVTLGDEHITCYGCGFNGSNEADCIPLIVEPLPTEPPLFRSFVTKEDKPK